MDLDELQSLTFEINSLQIASLHVAVDGEDDRHSSRELIDRLADTSEASPFAYCAREEMRTMLAAAVDRLPEKERLVISLYYVEELTMKEIGQILGVNESRVSQLHTKAVSRLRTAFVHLAA
jgi:RNA polymerase sigma factor for flagellar operon FliA